MILRGVAYALQPFEKKGGRIDVGEVDCEVVAKDPLDGFGFALAKKAVVYEYAVQFFADGPVQKDRDHR